MKTTRRYRTLNPLLFAWLALLMPNQVLASDWQEFESAMRSKSSSATATTATTVPTATDAMNTTAVKDSVIFESCTDGAGKDLPAVADEQQQVLVRTVTENDGSAAIRYNPTVLPQLSQAARLFLYTYECARHGLGGSDSKLSIAHARVADCRVVNTLLGSALLTRDALPSLQAEMMFSDAEWQLLSGPVRRFELTTCQQRRGDILLLPLNTPLTPRQSSWNDCERGCADKLWGCQSDSGGGNSACLDQHQQCRKTCGQAPTKAAE